VIIKLSRLAFSVGRWMEKFDFDGVYIFDSICDYAVRVVHVTKTERCVTSSLA
jgi:hypothetical protein